jgi:glucosyl-dolichyl phosphate glucuronosyltransferase
MMFLTVAICTWNRAALLDQTLAGMRHLHIPEGVAWELLVVNNACTDETDSIIERHQDALPICRLSEPTPGLSNARNCAQRHSKGQWIIWTDDDVLVDEQWLAAFAATATRHPEAAAIGGPILPWFPCDPDPDLLAAFPLLRDGFCGVDYGREERTLHSGESLHGANMAFHRPQMQGLSFDPRLGVNKDFRGGEEDLSFVSMVRARGGAVVWSPDMVVKHFVAPERMTLAHLQRYYMDAGEQAITLNGGMSAQPRLLGLPRWLLRRSVETFVISQASRLFKGRVPYLRTLKQYWLLRGMVRACKKQNKSTSNPPTCQGEIYSPGSIQ